MLSAVYIKGFKTFARPVRMPLEGGVTAIVGPNGSGKSNITDAVLFALGEQSPGLLRAGTMGDLIFSGSESLNRTNVAEVSLIFDNSSGNISLPYEEVSLTRRISRDGGTEYRINGSRARLSDIRSVAGEAGMGRHSILRQGAVDAIVSGGAEACRQALEEAAGLGVYRRKRLSASRRLEKADAQLEQSQNIEAELAAQLSRIEREAVAAREYREIEGRYRKLSLAHLYRTATRGVEGLERRICDGNRTVERLVAERVTHKETTEHLGRDLRSSEVNLHSLEAVISGLETSLERLRAESLATERSRYRVEARRGDADRRKRSVERLAGEAGRVASGLKALRKRYAEVEKATEEGSELRRIADADLDEKRRSVNSAESERAGLFARLEGIRARLSGIDTGHSTPAMTPAEAAAIGTAADTLDAPCGGLEPASTEWLRSRQAEHRDGIASLEAEINRRRGSLSAVAGRLESRARMLEDPGTNGASGPRLYEVVRARPGYEFAVEAALGEFGTGVLASDVNEGVSLLSQSERVAVRLDAQVMDHHDPAFLGTPLLECVEVLDDRYSDAVERLLGGIFVVDDAAQSNLNNGHIAVTRQGIRLTRTSVSLASSGRFAREARLAVYRDLLGRVASGPGSALDRVSEKLSDISSRRDSLASDIRDISGISSRVRRAKSLLVREARRRQVGIERTWQAAGERTETVARLRVEESETASELARVTDSLPQLRKDLGAAAARRDEVHISSGDTSRERKRLRAAISDGARRIDSISKTLDGSPASHEDPSDTLNSLSERILAASSSIGELGSKRLGSVRMKRAEGSEHYRKHSSRQAELARRSAELDGQLVAAKSEVERLELSLQRSRASSSEAEQEISDEWNATLEDARAEAEELPADVEPERGKLARRLKRFGDVNLLAISQQEEIRERYETISDQRSDAEEASRELNRIIHTIDVEIESRFTQTFGRVSGKFKEMVPQMLAGASGTLDLTDEGVEIGIRLGRKGWRSLKVLSGGERSLLALSFLFSILLSRGDESSTFCILDEAEAALDDVNLARFVSVVDSHRERGQFLLVTHQKRTMATADVLYGVVQDASGATSVVSKRIQGD